MSMVKYSPTALNFGYDFVLVVHFFGHPVEIRYVSIRIQKKENFSQYHCCVQLQEEILFLVPRYAFVI